MIAAVAVILVLPIVFTEGRHWSAVAGHATLYQAWLRLVEVGPRRPDFPWTTGGAWTVYAVWRSAQPCSPSPAHNGATRVAVRSVCWSVTAHCLVVPVPTARSEPSGVLV